MLRPEHIKYALGEVGSRLYDAVESVKRLETLKGTFQWNDANELIASILKVVEAQKEVVSKLEAMYKKIQDG